MLILTNDYKFLISGGTVVAIRVKDRAMALFKAEDTCDVLDIVESDYEKATNYIVGVTGPWLDSIAASYTFSHDPANAIDPKCSPI